MVTQAESGKNVIRAESRLILSPIDGTMFAGETKVIRLFCGQAGKNIIFLWREGVQNDRQINSTLQE